MWQEGLGDFHPFPGRVCEEGKQVKEALTGKSRGPTGLGEGATVVQASGTSCPVLTQSLRVGGIL